MNKIQFANNGQPAINDINLNLMQDNIEIAINNVDNKLTYSTEEQVVGTWIDGRNIYRKVIEFTIGSSLNTWNAITTINAEKIINLYGGVTIQGISFYPIPYSAYTGKDTETVYFYLDLTTGTLNERHNFEHMSNNPAYLIVEYINPTN